MINKYAEINDRILLYNACKGILRVKTAEDAPIAEPHPINVVSSATPAASTGKGKFNGVMAGAGTAIAAGGLGYAGSDWLTKKLGLTADRGGWRKWTGRGIKTIGTAGSALTGYAFGNALNNSYTDAYNAARILPKK